MNDNNIYRNVTTFFATPTQRPNYNITKNERIRKRTRTSILTFN